MTSRDNDRLRTYVADQLQDPQNFFKLIKELFDNPAAETYDLLHLRDDRVIERYAFPQYLKSHIVGRVLSFRDITARLQAETALKKSESNYRRIVETANEGIWAVDPEIRTIYVNQLMADMLGYSQEEMQGRPVTDFMFPGDQAGHQEKVDRRHRGKYEQRLRRQDGTELWTIVSVRALKGESGEFQGSFAMLTDITERKRAEEELKKSEKRVRAKLESILAPTGDIGQLDLDDIIDADGHPVPHGGFLSADQCPHGLDRSSGQSAGRRWLAGHLRQIPPGPSGNPPALRRKRHHPVPRRDPGSLQAL